MSRVEREAEAVKSRLLCEKEINESWSKVEEYLEEIILAVEKENPNERELALIQLAARAFIQKASFEKVDSVALFGVDLFDV